MEILKKYLDFKNIEYTEETIKKFEKYFELLIEWNEKINLTTITEKEEVEKKHFIDSLTVIDYLDENSSVIDIGTGAGFPSIPLCILRPDLKFTLLDSLNKRIKFLEVIVENLDLQNVELIHSRAEDLAKGDFRESFDYSIARAVAKMNTLLEYMSPYVKKCGKVIAMKSKDIENELELSTKAIRALSLEVEKVDKFKLFETDEDRAIVVLNKVAKCNKCYPRERNLPRKKPLI